MGGDITREGTITGTIGSGFDSTLGIFWKEKGVIPLLPKLFLTVR